jgi:hypothetical protein
VASPQNSQLAFLPPEVVARCFEQGKVVGCVVIPNRPAAEYRSKANQSRFFVLDCLQGFVVVVPSLSWQMIVFQSKNDGTPSKKGVFPAFCST